VLREGGRVFVRAPYAERFIREAKALPAKLRGKWDGEAKAWDFPAEAESAVLAICRDVYGDDGVTADLVTLRLTWRNEGHSWQAPFYVHGRVVARAFGRRTGAKLGEGVRVVAGGFDSGGTFRDWETVVRKGTVALVANIPRHEAEAIVAEQRHSSMPHAEIAGAPA
jgi:hypothetical protein